jgi:hypothetical protein
MFSRNLRAMPINANHPSSSSVTSSDQKKTKLNSFLVNTCMVTITVSGKRFHVQSYEYSIGMCSRTILGLFVIFLVMNAKGSGTAKKGQRFTAVPWCVMWHCRIACPL